MLLPSQYAMPRGAVAPAGRIPWILPRPPRPPPGTAALRSGGRLVRFYQRSCAAVRALVPATPPRAGVRAGPSCWSGSHAVTAGAVARGNRAHREGLDHEQHV